MEIVGLLECVVICRRITVHIYNIEVCKPGGKTPDNIVPRVITILAVCLFRTCQHKETRVRLNGLQVGDESRHIRLILCQGEAFNPTERGIIIIVSQCNNICLLGVLFSISPSPLTVNLRQPTVDGLPAMGEIPTLAATKTA